MNINILIALIIGYDVSIVNCNPELGSRNDWNKEYDFIVIGAGTAGCVIANRLTEDPSVNVLIVEAGGKESFFTDIPGYAQYLQRSEWDWKFVTEPQKNCFLDMNECRVPYARGKVLGGSSTINEMIYLRGNPNDFDNWAKIGCEGWSYIEVLPFFKKSETNTNKQFVENGFHGDSGPLPVTSSKNNPNPMGKYFIAAGKELGFKQIDLNGYETIGVNIPQQNIYKGSRVSSSKAFLESVIYKRRNLHVLTHAFVTKIIFSKNRTAEYVRFKRNNQMHNVRAKKEIVLSAGVIKSPHILLLSGIGPKNHLKEMNITLVSHIPGVGQNFNDHVACVGIELTVNTTGPSPFSNKSLKQYFFNRTGPLSYCEIPACLTNSKINCDNNWPDIQLGIVPMSKDGLRHVSDNKIFSYDKSISKYMAPYSFKSSIRFVVTVSRPQSRGYIRLKSSNPNQHPLLQPNYLTDSHDIKVLIDALRLTYEFARTDAFKSYNAKIVTNLFPTCESFYNKIDKIKLNFGIIEIPSDDYLECVARHATKAGYHGVGTCKMGPSSDYLSVVDPRLRVRNVFKLRVIDASIMPIITDANTNAATYMIGERGAQFIKEEYNLK